MIGDGHLFPFPGSGLSLGRIPNMSKIANPNGNRYCVRFKPVRSSRCVAAGEL